MKLYKISLTADFGDCDGRSVWTSRKSDIPSLKRKLSQGAIGYGWGEPSVEEVEFTATRQGILEMLNRYADRG